MYLKELVLENFKSFGGKTRLELQTGYTVITGPNGSGKSNISDAILFVLGPRSSKVIRAGKLTDLIYNGGKSKNAASHASVSATFDNSDRMIPFDSDLVTFTRVVNRSQDGSDYSSHFYINGRKSSLGEFEGLLREAKLSADGYNFVQQGDVTHIIEMGNVERRRILDDIAGITTFDSEIEKAERERVETEQNISTARSVLSELKGNLSRLQREKEAAERFAETKKRLENLKLALALRKLSSCDMEIETIGSQIESFTKQAERLSIEAQAGGKELQELEAQLKAKEEEISREEGDEAREIRAKVDSCKIDIAKRSDGRSISEEQLKEIQERIASLKTRLKEERRQLEKAKSDLESAERALTENSSTLSAKRAELKALERSAGDTDQRSRALQKEIEEINRKISSLNDELGTLKIEESRLRDRIERGELEKAAAEKSVSNAELEYKDVCWQLKEIDAGHKDREGRLRELNTKFSSLRNRESGLRERVGDLEKEIRIATREYERLKAQREARTDGLSRALNAILELRDRGEIKGILGSFRELISVDAEYEQAINAAAGGRINAVVVEDDATAAECIVHLKKNGLGRLIFLPLNRMLESKPRGKAVMVRSQTLGFAMDLMKFDDRLRAAAWYVVGDTLVVRDLDEMRKLMGGIRLVTLDGDIAEAGGAMIGGSQEKLQPQAAHSAGIKEAGEKLRKLNDELQQKSSELDAVSTELRAVEELLRKTNEETGETGKLAESLKKKKVEFERELNERAMRLASVREQVEKDTDALKAVQKSIEEREKAIAELRQERQNREGKLIEGKPEEVASAMVKLRKEIEQLSTDSERISAEAAGARTSMQFIEKSVEELLSQIREEEAKAQELKEKIERLGAEEEKLRVELIALQKIESRIGEVQASLRNERDSLLQKVLEIRASLSKMSERKESIAEMLVIQKNNLQNAIQKRKEIEVEISLLRDAGGVPVDGDMTVDALKDAVAECERVLERMGGVNMLAIEDFEQVNSRCQALEADIKGFEEKKKSLIKLVEEINEKKKQGLLRVFGAINTNFADIYFKLSGGFEGKLELENEKDPLQGGLIIRVRQKERKSLRIEALSGGEKSLAALAFIFAIQQYDPSPVYFLDEVDMFLDGVNSEAVARMVRSLSSSAQFLQVSLRKVSLNWADRLIGVTRAEDGISHVFYREVGMEGQGAVPQGVEG